MADASTAGGPQVLRNAFLNLSGQLLPLAVGIMVMPATLRLLGPDRFGVLALGWALLGYAMLLDFGLGRAVTNYVARSSARPGVDNMFDVVLAALAVQVAMGLVLGALLIGTGALILDRLLDIPDVLRPEVHGAVYVLAASIPVVLISSSLLGTLEGVQRFDLVNSIRIPLNVITLAAPLLGALAGLGLPGIFVLLALARLSAVLVAFNLASRLLPRNKGGIPRLGLLRPLVAYGGWVSLSGLVAPLLVYLDRFLLASLVSISAVAYYAAPYEVITRLWVVPVSVTMALFPAFGYLQARGDRVALEEWLVRSVKLVLLLLAPLVATALLFATEFLHWWLGGDFALQSAGALQVLAIGVLINSLGHVPFAFLQGIGRPDLTAKFHLIELPVYVIAAFAFIARWGVAGAAAAWTLRVTMDTILLVIGTFAVSRLPLRIAASRRFGHAAAAVLLLFAASSLARLLTRSLPLSVSLIGVGFCIVLFAGLAWRLALEDTERSSLASIFVRGPKEKVV